jgi:uncharacterized protein YndB with AHSA1/START domain
MAGMFGTAVCSAKAGECVSNDKQSASDDEDEQREYSSPACYLHEFESYNRVDTASRLIHAAPEKIYRAHMDPRALIEWLPPQGMSGRIDRFEPRVGGSYRMVLTYAQPAAPAKTTEDSDSMQGRFIELVPDRLIVQLVTFDSNDPAFAGEMKITWTFMPVAEGTRVDVRCENVPRGIRPQDHAAGLSSSLANLAKFCE